MLQGPIGILGAMASEVQFLLAALDNGKTTEKHGVSFHEGTLYGHPVVIVQCGIGKVNAARCAQMLIDLFEPAALVNTGVAGGLGAGLHVGDIILGERVAQHDFDLSPLGYIRGNVNDDDHKDQVTYFHSDSRLLQRLLLAAQSIAPERNPHSGCIISGDAFLADSALKARLVQLFQADAGEMEGAAIGQVATLSGVPFAVLRVVSDLADGTSPASFPAFAAETAKLSSQILLRFFEREE